MKYSKIAAVAKNTQVNRNRDAKGAMASELYEILQRYNSALTVKTIVYKQKTISQFWNEYITFHRKRKLTFLLCNAPTVVELLQLKRKMRIVVCLVLSNFRFGCVLQQLQMQCFLND